MALAHRFVIMCLAQQLSLATDQYPVYWKMNMRVNFSHKRILTAVKPRGRTWTVTIVVC